jgi:bacterial leucyl aminopeptidase
VRLTSFHTRFYRSASGAAAASWIQSQLETYAKEAHNGWNITISPFTHSWPQNSVIVHMEDINASEDAREGGVVILGAHLDSINWLNPWFGRSPGADDDGSGNHLYLCKINAKVP